MKHNSYAKPRLFFHLSGCLGLALLFAAFFIQASGIAVRKLEPLSWLNSRKPEYDYSDWIYYNYLRGNNGVVINREYEDYEGPALPESDLLLIDDCLTDPDRQNRYNEENPIFYNKKLRSWFLAQAIQSYQTAQVQPQLIKPVQNLYYPHGLIEIISRACNNLIASRHQHYIDGIYSNKKEYVNGYIGIIKFWREGNPAAAMYVAAKYGQYERSYGHISLNNLSKSSRTYLALMLIGSILGVSAVAGIYIEKK